MEKLDSAYCFPPFSWPLLLFHRPIAYRAESEIADSVWFASVTPEPLFNYGIVTLIMLDGRLATPEASTLSAM
jgi:hypothetical protein